MSSRFLFVVLLFLSISAPASAQYWDTRALEGDPARAKKPLAPKLEGLGTAQHPVTTTQNPASQAFFTQGVNLVYAFNHPEAVRAFKEAARLDPNNAMAYWGWALALGPNLNLPMQPDAVPGAWTASRKALSLKSRASPVEQAMIDAVAVRYSNDPNADRAALDKAYAEAMGKVAAQFPDHLGAATLYADALMNVSAWNYWTRDGRPREYTPTIVKTLESVLAQNPNHAGALHLYIHAVEAVNADKAEAGADRLINLMPAAGHLVHMPSHIYMQVGRYADAYETNVRATQADESYLTQCRAQGIVPLLYYPHNMHFQVWAAMFQGRSATALADARKIAKHTHLQPEVFGLPEHFDNQPMYVLVRFGRWSDVLNEPQPPKSAPFMNAIWHYGRGLAYQHTGKPADAKKELAALRAIAADPALEPKTMAFSSLPVLLTIADNILAAEIDAGEKNYDQAIARLERAVHLQDGLLYNEPPDWYFPARHILGAVLLEAGYPAEAETVYWQDLARQRENGYALFGLMKAQEAQGKTAEAAAVKARFDRAWAQADTRLTSSRF
jgi:tetratricopeptide (TPR) repeat protein